MITQQYVDEVGAELLQSCPLVSESPEASQVVREKIRGYIDKLGILPAASLVVNSFAMPLENQLKAEQEAENETARREAARQARIDRDMHRPSSYDRAEAEAEFKARQPQPQVREFAPRKNWTEKEIDAMDSETYAREIMGVPDSDKNRSVGPPIEKKKVQTIKRQAYDSRRAAEESDRLARNKQIRLDADQKKQLRADLKAALMGAK